MENIIVEDLGNGFKRLTPKEGYVLYNKLTKQTYSEAVVKNTKPYIAIPIEK